MAFFQLHRGISLYFRRLRPPPASKHGRSNKPCPAPWVRSFISPTDFFCFQQNRWLRFSNSCRADPWVGLSAGASPGPTSNIKGRSPLASLRPSPATPLTLSPVLLCGFVPSFPDGLVGVAGQDRSNSVIGAFNSLKLNSANADLVTTMMCSFLTLTTL